MKAKLNVPRTMDNCLIDGKCEYCGTKFGTRPLIWVWNEHFGCSRQCVVASHEKGESEYQAKQKKEKDSDLL